MAAWQKEIQDFTAHLIKIRQAHRVFQRSGYLQGENVEYVNVPDIAWFSPDGNLFTNEDWQDPQTRAIGMYLAGAISDGINTDMVDNGFYFFLNSGDNPVTVNLPAGDFAKSYRLMFNTVDSHDWEKFDLIPAGSQVVLARWSSALWMVTSR